ncbi:hypothetical protein B1759_15030 [Rubrivirga sp. SAORIC476]|uniref:HNH endonuclease signature motif containing protein n=1 Tax=Rubrivirga sp. SAORIC476 TaxID=1961794 RepID=UPI000BCADC27|nr:HNH endonuclease signature motif containing protein [Rubrivirga sp. SAORIC476]PAP79794.1 hypothetical protein B1759_15030 [Rubrivirga sp. SAORIC476]
MPTLRRACQYPGCPASAERGAYSCAAHARPSHEPAVARPSAASRGYDAKWRRVRAMFLRKHPVCVGTVEGSRCGRPATEVDHITPLADGGTNEWANLQPFCKSCHSRKTAAENRGAGGRIARRTQ